jgi:hypothetical protein
METAGEDFRGVRNLQLSTADGTLEARAGWSVRCGLLPMIRLILTFFAVLLVMGLYIGSYFLAVKPITPGKGHHGARTASYKMPYVTAKWAASGYLARFYAPVQYVDEHWVRPGIWAGAGATPAHH